MLITLDNVEVANQAMRDILFMYRDMAESYGGFGGTIACGSFDPFDFLDARVSNEKGYDLEVDLDLLRQGSSIAVLCWLHDALSKSPESARSSDFYRRIVEARDAGHFDFDSDLRAAIEAGTSFDKAMFERLQIVYDRFVRPYFQRLAES